MPPSDDNLCFVQALVIAMLRTKAEGFVDQIVNTNIILASFTTALACLKLYSVLEKLDDRVLYIDTYVVVFRTNPDHAHLDSVTGRSPTRATISSNPGYVVVLQVTATGLQREKLYAK